MLIMVMADTVDPEITRVVPGLTAILRRRRRQAVVAVKAPHSFIAATARGQPAY